MSVASRKFKNEHGRKIDLRVSKCGDKDVCIRIVSPRSFVDHTITLEEAENLRDALVLVLGSREQEG